MQHPQRFAEDRRQSVRLFEMHGLGTILPFHGLGQQIIPLPVRFIRDDIRREAKAVHEPRHPAFPFQTAAGAYLRNVRSAPSTNKVFAASESCCHKSSPVQHYGRMALGTSRYQKRFPFSSFLFLLPPKTFPCPLTLSGTASASYPHSSGAIRRTPLPRPTLGCQYNTSSGFGMLILAVRQVRQRENANLFACHPHQLANGRT